MHVLVLSSTLGFLEGGKRKSSVEMDGRERSAWCFLKVALSAAVCPASAWLGAEARHLYGPTPKGSRSIYVKCADHTRPGH